MKLNTLVFNSNNRACHDLMQNEYDDGNLFLSKI